MDFDGFTRQLEVEQLNVHGVEVYENGELTHSWGDTRNTRYSLQSVTKSFLSVAFGIARDRGLISEKDAVIRYMPEEYVSAMNGEQRKLMSELTFKRLLTMSVAGYPFRPEGENWLKFSLNYPPEHPEQPAFNYSNIPVYIVSVALTQALGQDVFQFMDENIFRPLGIGTPVCQRSPEGYFYGATGVELTVNEMSRLGLALCAGGVYKGRRIVSETYVRDMTGMQQMNREGGYGFYTWKYRSGFSLNGQWGQKCYCLPDRGLMITFMSHIENGADRVRELMEQYLIGD